MQRVPGLSGPVETMAQLDARLDRALVHAIRFDTDFQRIVPLSTKVVKRMGVGPSAKRLLAAAAKETKLAAKTKKDVASKRKAA